MGQYWVVVNLDKKEFIHPHRLGSGLKLWEQLAAHPATGAALIVLCAAMPEIRGGGDFDLDSNWHGLERTSGQYEGPIVDEYNIIAKRTIGRWAGDRIALVGDYAEDEDLPVEFNASDIYNNCFCDPLTDCEAHEEHYLDISNDVCAVIEHELRGHYEGDGWRRFISETT